MLRFISLVTLLTFFSCSSFKKQRTIKEENYDGLKFESLTRYNLDRLGTPLKTNDPLALCHAGEFQKANSIFKSQLDDNLKNYVYWNQISTCYILEKKYTQAKKFLDLALGMAKTENQKSSVLNNFGVIQLELENYDSAKEYFKKAIELAPKTLTPRYNLSQIYLKFALYSNAKEQLEFLLDKNNQDIDFLNSYAHLQLMEKKYQKALQFFDKIPSDYRSRDDIATNLGMSYFMLGKLEDAKKTLNNAEKKDSYYVNAQLDIMKKIEKEQKAGKL